MKHTLKLMALALMAIATLTTAACSKDDNGNGGNNEPPTFESLVNTEWAGTFQTVGQSPQGVIPVTLEWTFDFAADGQLDVMFNFKSTLTPDNPFDWKGTYTYDPATMTGTFSCEDFEGDSFTLDPYNRTIKAGLGIYAEHEAGADGVFYGGMTTLHQVR